MSLAFSVVIPTLNEEKWTPGQVRRIHTLDSRVQVIVVDAGSTDDTVAKARDAGAEVCRAPAGRGKQMNAGAARASGDILLFLHADTLLPRNAFELLGAYFNRPDINIGTFRLRFDRNHWLLRLYAIFSRLDSVFTTFGDQCIVVRRGFFEALGGFPNWPLFEDVALLQRARAVTRVYSFPAAVTTSARRFEQAGVVRQSLRNAWLVLRYLAGSSPFELAEEYENA